MRYKFLRDNRLVTTNLLITNKERTPEGEYRRLPRHGKMQTHTEDGFGPALARGRFVFRSMLDE
jgi:hypothetical protein